jgi:hypothetical protein
MPLMIKPEVRKPKPLARDARTGMSTNAARGDSLRLRIAASTPAMVSAPHHATTDIPPFLKVESLLSIGTASLSVH